MSSRAQKQRKQAGTDVLVVGGGTAGFVAAIAAARNGAAVIKRHGTKMGRLLF